MDKSKQLAAWIESHDFLNRAALCKKAKIDRGNFDKFLKSKTFPEQHRLAIVEALGDYGYKEQAEVGISLPADYVETGEIVIRTIPVSDLKTTEGRKKITALSKEEVLSVAQAAKKHIQSDSTVVYTPTTPESYDFPKLNSVIVDEMGQYPKIDSEMFMGQPIPEGLKDIALAVWKNEVKIKAKRAIQDAKSKKSTEKSTDPF